MSVTSNSAEQNYSKKLHAYGFSINPRKAFSVVQITVRIFCIFINNQHDLCCMISSIQGLRSQHDRQ